MAQAFVVGGGGGGVGSDELTAVAANVMKGYTYVGKDTNDETGTGTLELTGSAGVGDVLSGATFYNTNPQSKQTGTLALTGNAGVGDVVSGKTFYSTNAKSKQTGTLALSGNAAVGNVLSGVTFYSNSLTKQTGAMVNNGTWNGSVGRNNTVTIPGGYHSGSGKVTGPSMTDKGATTHRASTADQTLLAAGIYTTGAQTLAKVTNSNLSAGNIKKGVTISVSNGASNLWSVAGTFTGLGNATAADVRTGKTFSTASLSNATGTIPNFTGQTVTPSTSAQTVSTSGKYATANVTVNAIPSTYKQVGSTTSFFDFGGARYYTGWDQYNMNEAPISFRGWTNYGKSYTKGSGIVFSSIPSGTDTTCTFILFRPINVSAFKTLTSISFMLKGPSNGRVCHSCGLFACNDGEAGINRVDSWPSTGAFNNSKLTYDVKNLSSYKWLFLMLGFFSSKSGTSSTYYVSDALVYLD